MLIYNIENIIIILYLSKEENKQKEELEYVNTMEFYNNHNDSRK